LRLLGFDAVVRADDPVVTRALTELYGPLSCDEPAEHIITFTRTRDDICELHLDGARILHTESPAVAFSHLIWELNRQTIEHTTGRTLVHASAAARGGQAVVLVGPMGSGKSTLVAALVQAGFGYVTDEVVAINPETLLVDPYPKPISLGGAGGSVPDALAALQTLRPAGLESYLGDHWLVAPERVRPGAVADRTMIGAVVVPDYVPHAPARLEPLSRPEAVLTLAEHTFQLGDRPEDHLDALARVVAEASCHRLISGDPDGAVAALRPLLERAEAAT